MSQNNSAQNSEQIPNYNVTFFAVRNATQIENCRYTDVISPFFETVDQATEFKVEALAKYPECFISENTVYFRSEDDGNRLELLAKLVRANPESKLLDQLQQRINDVKDQLSTQHIELFSSPLSHIQKVHDFLRDGIGKNDFYTDSCMRRLTEILEARLDEIREDAQNEQNQTVKDFRDRMQESIDSAKSDFNLPLTSNQFYPRAKKGEVLMMRKGSAAEDGDIVAVNACMQENVNGQWVDIEPGIALRLQWYRPGMEYYAVCVAVCPARPAELDAA
jgi:hypothetical protein